MQKRPFSVAGVVVVSTLEAACERVIPACEDPPLLDLTLELISLMQLLA
jgi:hypothetical protein